MVRTDRVYERLIADEGIGHRAVVPEVSSAGAAATINFDDGLVHRLTLDDNVTLTFAEEPDDTTVLTAYLVFTQDGTGGRTVTWPANVAWRGGTDPGVDTDADAVTVVELVRLPGADWVGRRWEPSAGTAASNGASVTYVGTSASPVTDASTARPDVDGPVYWVCANGVTPTNAETGDIIFNADA